MVKRCTTRPAYEMVYSWAVWGRWWEPKGRYSYNLLLWWDAVREVAELCGDDMEIPPPNDPQPLMRRPG
jgi:hypothetical protein